MGYEGYEEEPKEVTLPIPPPPPSKTKEHWQRGKQRLAKLFSALKKLHSGLGTVGDEWGKMSKHFNRNFNEMYGEYEPTDTFTNWGVWTEEPAPTVKRRNKKRKHK